jgi:hypothetical protein
MSLYAAGAAINMNDMSICTISWSAMFYRQHGLDEKHAMKGYRSGSDALFSSHQFP